MMSVDFVRLRLLIVRLLMVLTIMQIIIHIYVLILVLQVRITGVRILRGCVVLIVLLDSNLMIHEFVLISVQLS